MKCILIWIVVSLIFLTNICLAEEIIEKKEVVENTEWKPVIAKKLTASSWEEVIKKTRKPLIIYFFQFQQLNSKVSSDLEAEIKVAEENNSSSKTGWEIYEDDDVLQLLQNQSDSYSVKISDWQNKKYQSSNYSSWLTTTVNNSVFVQLRERIIPITESVEEDEQFLELEFIPKKIYLNKNKVLTRITFDYERVSGVVASTTITGLIGKEVPKPIAVVSKQVDDIDNQEYDYFALYVSSTIITPARADRFKFTSIGDVKGLNNFFSHPSLTEDKKSNMFMVYLNKDKLGIELDKSFGDKNVDIYMGRRSGNLSYKAGLEKRLYEEEKLSIVGQMDENILGNIENPILRFGLTDQVDWFNNIDCKITCFPFNLDLETEKLLSASYNEILIKWKHQKWNIWGQGTYIDKEKKNKCGLMYKVSDKFGIRIIGEKEWGKLTEDEQRLYLALVWQLR